MEIKWNSDSTLTINPPKRPKVLTGTRFASVLGLNKWSTPFQMWCEITKAATLPFEDTIYTKAGKAIEPKQIAFLKDYYFMNLKTPADVFGKDYFSKTYGNFYTDKIFGGMWDSLIVDENDNTTGVVEFKTTKRAEDWLEDIPEYYALQAALYAWLSGVEDVLMVATFLHDTDYDDPESFVVIPENTITRPFKVHERYPRFEEDYIEPAKQWYETHVYGGVSPKFDEHQDREYLELLEKVSVRDDESLDALCNEYSRVVSEIEYMTPPVVKYLQKRKTELSNLIKSALQEKLGESTSAEFQSNRNTFTLKRGVTTTVDTKALEADGLLDKYSKEKETFRLSVKDI